MAEISENLKKIQEMERKVEHNSSGVAISESRVSIEGMSNIGNSKEIGE